MPEENSFHEYPFQVSEMPMGNLGPRARTPEGREDQLIAMAYDLVEKRIREGTATSQELTHFLKLGTTRERLEREILSEQKRLISAKIGSIESSAKIEEMYSNAINAMKHYSGQDRDD